ERRGGALFAVEWDAIRGLGVARMDRSGEPEVRRQPRRAEAPGRLPRIAPVHLLMDPHETHAALDWVRKKLVDAVEDVRTLARGTVHFVVLYPRRAAVLSSVHAADTDADHHLLRILRVDGDRVQAHSAEARHPLRAGRLVVETLHDRPGLAAILALEERSRLGARPDHVRRLGVSGLDVPGL